MGQGTNPAGHSYKKHVIVCSLVIYLPTAQGNNISDSCRKLGGNQELTVSKAILASARRIIIKIICSRTCPPVSLESFWIPIAITVSAKRAIIPICRKKAKWPTIYKQAYLIHLVSYFIEEIVSPLNQSRCINAIQTEACCTILLQQKIILDKCL